jgi:hypothetical protein
MKSLKQKRSAYRNNVGLWKESTTTLCSNFLLLLFIPLQFVFSKRSLSHRHRNKHKGRNHGGRSKDIEETIEGGDEFTVQSNLFGLQRTTTTMGIVDCTAPGYGWWTSDRRLVLLGM